MIGEAKQEEPNIRDIINDYLAMTDGDIKENANDGYSISGFKSHLVQKMLKEISLHDSIAGDYHKNGLIHIHDLGGSLYSAYCCGHDLRELLLNGIGINSGCSSRAPKHFQSACDLMFNYLQILSNEWEGAQAFSDVDILLAPYIKEDMEAGIIRHFNDIKQCVQSLVFGLNYESRQGFQAPFTNFTIRYIVPENMKDEPCLYAGEPQDYTYGELQEYVNLFNQAFFEVLYEGDGKGRPLTFPIPTITVDSLDIFEEESKVTDIFWKLVRKFGSPYFSNYLGAGGNPEDAKSMCCRLRLDVDEVRQATGIWDIGVKTGSLGVCTINLNRISLMVETEEDKLTTKDKLAAYRNILFDIADKSSQQLIQRKDYVYKAFFDYGLMPYSKKYVGKLNTFFLTLGIVGGWEAYNNLFTKEEKENISFTEFSKFILTSMRDIIDVNKEKYDWKLWNIEQTPAEGAGHRLAELDKFYYPKSYISGEKGGYYLTNSTHYPVYSDADFRDELYHTDEIDPLYTGGTLKNIYIDEAPNVDSIKAMIQSIMQNTKIPYIAYTPAFSVCEEHGIQYGLDDVCQECGNEVEVFTRVVGYIRPTKKFNNGQANQTKDRKFKHVNEE